MTRFGRITTEGAISNFTGFGIDRPYAITSGPRGDGDMWFADQANAIGRITTQ